MTWLYILAYVAFMCLECQISTKAGKNQNIVRRAGFEPAKPIGRLIYSQMRLTTPPPAHKGHSIIL